MVPSRRYGGFVHRVHGVVQHYAWGDTEFLPRFLGTEPDGRPWAEWWLGTHPSAPSTLADGRPLVAETGTLPYLLKVLAAAEPLSLQTHPGPERARRGYERGVYPDPHPKPELLHALTPFTAFCGVRPVDTTVTLLRELELDALAARLVDHGVADVLAALLHRQVSTEEITAACSRSDRDEARWVCRLAARHPGDPSAAATLLLNLVTLQPGQAIRLAAGNLHAYLCGAGIELMGPSDNVVRAGLTAKPVDVDELLEVVDPEPLVHPTLDADEPHVLPDLGLELRTLGRRTRHRALGHELAVDAAGRAWYLAPGEQVTVSTTTHVVTASTA